MKNTAHFKPLYFPGMSLRGIMLLVLFLATSTLANAATVTITSPVVSSTTITLAASDTIATKDIRVNDGVILTVTRSGTGTGNVFPTAVLSASSTVTIAASGSGRVIFRDINVFSTGVQGAFAAMGANSTLDVSGADFINIRSGTSGNGVAGVLIVNNTGARATFSNVYFEGNYNRGNTGVSRVNNGTLTFVEAIFKGNYSPTGNSGVLDVRGTGILSVTQALFDSNRAYTYGGALGITGGTVTTLTDVEFKNNWAGTFGGAIYSTIAGVIPIKLTGTTGVSQFIYSGNIAGAVSSGNFELVANNVAPAAVARAGGFYYTTAAGNLLLDIAGNVELTIGDAAQTNKSIDSIASTVTTSSLTKTGSGALVLNADNAYWQGKVNVNAGSLLLGNADARLGGNITVASGAMFGGSGTVTTLSQTDTALATLVTAKAGSIIQIGNGGSTDRLSVSGTFVAEAGALFKYDLFADNKSGLLDMNHFQIAGTGTIQLGSVASGTFTLATWQTSNFTNSNLWVIAGASGNPRIGATGSVGANEYLLTIAIANSSNLAWTGAGGALWQANGTQLNWSGTTLNGAVQDFQNGDTVYFGDATSVRTITIEPANISVGAMIISGTGDYTFNGGGIISTGTLVKSGTGTLNFGNAANTFAGMEVAGGVIAFSDAAQLGGGTGTLHFSNDAMLKATGNGTSFGNALAVDAGKMLTIDTNGNSLTHSGDLTGILPTGTFVKIGAGTLFLAANNAGYGAATVVRQGALLLSEPAAKLGGAVTVDNGATIGGAGQYTGSVNLGSGAILQVGVDATIANLTINSLALNGGIISFDLFAGNTADKLTITSLTTIAGTNIIDIGRFQLGSHVIASGALSASGKSMDSFGVTIGGRSQTGARQTMQLSIVGTDLIATGSSDASRSLTWTGKGSTNTAWDSFNLNWVGSATIFADGDRVTFDSTSPAATHDISIAGTQMTVSDIIVSGSSDYSFSGAAITSDASSMLGNVLSGAAGKLTKDGTGKLTLATSGMNDFKGGIDLKGGTLSFASAGASGTSAINILGAATTLQISATGLALANAVNLGANNLVFDTQDYNTSLSGVIAGTGGFTKIGTGTLTLNATNSYTGATSIANGSLKAGAAGVLASSNSVEIKSGATFDMGGFAQTAKNLTGAGAINLGAAILTVDSTADSIFSGNMAGTGKLIKTGAAKLELTGTNTINGGIDIISGVLGVGSASAIGSGAVIIGPAAKLQFHDISSGTVDNILFGSAVEVINSTLLFRGTNDLEHMLIGSGGRLTAGSVTALGGANVAVTVGDGGSLILATQNTVANSMTVQNGGKIIFNNSGAIPLLKISNDLVLEHNSTVALGTVVSGSSLLMQVAGTITDRGAAFDGGPNIDIIDFIIDTSGNVSVVALNQAANPGKDIAAIYDAVSAATGAVYSRLSESFLTSLERIPHTENNGLWLKGVGSYSDYDSTPGKTGYKNDSYGVVAGYDRKFSDKLFLGAYVGCLSSKITTDNHAESEGTMPHVGAYGAIRQGIAYLAGDIMVGSFDGDSTRFEQTGFATGSYKTTAIGGSVELGTVIGAWEDGSIKPAVALHYMSLSYRDQKENGPGAVSVNDFNDNRLESLVSVQITQGFATPWKHSGMFDMFLGWRASLKDSPTDISGHFMTAIRQNFIVREETYNRDGIALGFGLRFGLTDKASFGLGYDYEIGRDFDRHNFSGALRFNW